MDYDKLKELLRERNITVVPEEAMRVRGYDVDTYRKLAKQTESVDYDCDFHDGICHGLALGATGCCMHCASAFGYWHKEGGVIDEDTLRKIAEFFDERTGFLREGVRVYHTERVAKPDLSVHILFRREDVRSRQGAVVSYPVREKLVLNPLILLRKRCRYQGAFENA